MQSLKTESLISKTELGILGNAATGVSFRIICIANAFGEFQQQLSDLPGDRLHETIPNFHNTPYRIEQLINAANTDKIPVLPGQAAHRRRPRYHQGIILHTGESPCRL